MITSKVKLEKFDYEELIKHRGTKKFGFHDIGTQPDGSLMRIPYLIVVGKNDGPTILLDGGIHGDEVVGGDASAIVARELDPETLSGVYIAVPHMNLEAYNICKRMNVSTDYTNVDMNRIFPGDEKGGKISAYILSQYLKYFVDKCQYWIQFHDGGGTLYLEPQAFFYNPETDKIHGKLTFDLAHCFNTPIMCQVEPGVAEFANATSSDDYAQSRKIAYISIEAGGSCVQFDEREKIFNLIHDGIMNVLKYLKMVDEKLPPLREDFISCPLSYLHITHGGIHHQAKRIYDKCRKGEVLAYVTDIFGETIDELIAPYDGIVIGTWTPPVIQPREWSTLYGKLDW